MGMKNYHKNPTSTYRLGNNEDGIPYATLISDMAWEMGISRCELIRRCIDEKQKS